MRRLVPVSATTLLLAIFVAANASAQNADCQTVQFSQSVLQRFPNVRDECRDVITREQQEFAVLKSELTRTTRNSISVRFKRPDGSPGQSRTFKVRPEFRVLVDGKPMRIEELAIGQELTTYVKVTEPMLALAPAAADEPLDLSPFAEDPAPPGSKPELSQAGSGPVLPRTAGALPMFGMTGLALTLIGFVLTIQRRMCLQRVVWRTTTVFLLVAMLQACAHKPSEPLIRDELVQTTATIEAVDRSQRLVSLRGPKGLTTINVAPDVRNFEQVQVGDHVVVSYYVGIAAQMKKRGAPSDGFENAITAVEAPDGARPAHGVGQTIATTVKIESVDTSFDTVTFRRPDGFVRTLAIESPEGRAFIRKLSPGDEVDVIYTEAIAVEVVPVS